MHRNPVAKLLLFGATGDLAQRMLLPSLYGLHADGLLPEDQVAPLRDWLHALAADQEQRAAVVRQTLSGALDSLDARVAALADAHPAWPLAAVALGLLAVAVVEGSAHEERATPAEP